MRSEQISQLLEEGLIAMSAAASILGSVRGTQPVHPATISRWGRKGISLPDGTTLKLETITLNGRQSTTRAAVIRFLQAQQSLQSEPEQAVRSPAARNRAAEEAARELDSMGIR